MGFALYSQEKSRKHAYTDGLDFGKLRVLRVGWHRDHT